MAAKSKINWSLNGKKTSPQQIKADLIEAYEWELYAAAGKLYEALDNLCQRLAKRSSNRGQGFLAARYNNVFEDLRVEAEVNEAGDSIRIFVPDDNKAGQIFNILDSGSPSRSSKGSEPMRFPAYSGTVTSPDKFSLNRSGADVNSLRWISTTHVEEIPARNFYRQVLTRTQYKNLSLRGVRFGSINRKPPKYKWSSTDVDVKVVKRGE